MEVDGWEDCAEKGSEHALAWGVQVIGNKALIGSKSLVSFFLSLFSISFDCDT